MIVDFDWAGVELETEFTNMAGEDQHQWCMEDVTVPEENILVRGKEEQRELFSFFGSVVSLVRNAATRLGSSRFCFRGLAFTPGFDA